MLIGSVLYGQGAGDALFIDPKGWIGIGTNTPKATLDVAGKLNVSENSTLSNAAITGSLTTSDSVGVGMTNPGESLRDIEACLRVAQPKLYHMGFRGPVARNTLAHANQVRDWRIYADFAHGLITTARALYATEAFGVELEQTVYALDATVIDLCLALFPWATFRQRKGAVKLHTLLDLRGNIPSVLFITPGRVHDVNILDALVVEAGAFYILDRGYLDFARLYRLHQALGFFVTRAKRNFRFRYLDSRPVDRTTGVHSDQTVVKKRLQLEASLYAMLQVLSGWLFEKIPLVQALTLPQGPALEDDTGNQLILFE